MIIAEVRTEPPCVQHRGFKIPKEKVFEATAAPWTHSHSVQTEWMLFATCLRGGQHCLSSVKLRTQTWSWDWVSGRSGGGGFDGCSNSSRITKAACWQTPEGPPFVHWSIKRKVCKDVYFLSLFDKNILAWLLYHCFFLLYSTTIIFQPL